ncbi:MAG: phosphoglucomutase, alpha-D-glucose phosphate-specific [Planctomycetota bacterium]|nr:MAG: phosphoglucomutase, alpha-D-glucose phosphate-specific [Planctomycetota bacterium]
MSTHALAGQRAPDSLLADIPALLAAYAERVPEPGDPTQRVAFGTSGHRGSSLKGAFNEAHIVAICQALAEHRGAQGIDGPLFVAHDTHALSEPALETAIEVLAANDVTLMLDSHDRPVPTPLLSHAIRAHNARGEGGTADGIVITPSHNPPEDGGFKYNPPHGGPAGSAEAGAIETRANELLVGKNRAARRVSATVARAAAGTRRYDFVSSYVAELGDVLDMAAMRDSGLRLGADPLGGTALTCWSAIADRWGLDLTLVNGELDPSFSMVPLDKDGRIRMDCSSPYVMAGLVQLGDRFDLAFGNDADADRHGIVTPAHGLMNPNHYLAVCIDYLFTHRPGWSAQCAVGKTLVSSSLIDRVAARLARRLIEVPVGFKWFVQGLADGGLGFGGEESAGASFLRQDGRCWTTDKDGLILALLAAEITAVTGQDPHARYQALVAEHGEPLYQRLDAPCAPAQKAALSRLSADQVTATQLAGEPITAILTEAPGNGAPIGGLKVCTENGWFAARPSGTEDVSKIYAESFLGAEHLAALQAEAQALVSAAVAVSG